MREEACSERTQVSNFSDKADTSPLYLNRFRDVPFLMAWCRSIFAFGLALLWAANPALACLPSATMTKAEMACCKKMAGDCHMGAGQHSCCKTKADRATPIATGDRPVTQVHLYFAATLLGPALFRITTIEWAEHTDLRGLPPPAPPGLNPILRI